MMPADIPPAPAFKPLDAVITRAVQEQRIVGTVVLVAHHGKVVYQRAAGWSDREAQKPMQPDSIFRLASVTKPMVTAAAMQLEEEGRLPLQAPVTRWLPDFRPSAPSAQHPTITLEQLITHTSGLSYGFIEGENSAYARARVSDGLNQSISLAENLKRLASVPLVYTPRTGWRYSLSIDVLGGVMEAETRQSLPEIVRTRITEPLGMKDTGFAVTDEERLTAVYKDAPPAAPDKSEPAHAALRMKAQDTVDMGGSLLHFDRDHVWDKKAYPSGGGGMVGTAPDFMKFLLGLRPNARTRVLRPDTVRQMMLPHVNPAWVAWMKPGWSWGYGWAVLDDPATAQTPMSKGTLQWGGVYGHNWFYDPVRDVAVVAFTNTTVEGMSGTFTTDVTNAVYGALTESPKK